MPKIDNRYINRAKKSELKVLYAIFMNGGNTDTEVLCRETEETLQSVCGALAFWRCAGVLDEEDEAEDNTGMKYDEKKQPEKAVAEKIITPRPASYTIKEIAAIKDRDSKFASLISYFEKITGHLYNSAEQGIVLYLYDTLGIDCEVIMGIAQYCASIGKNSLRYIERTIINITEAGVSSYNELENYLARQKNTKDYFDMVKKIIGAEDRALSKSENTHISRWQKEFDCSEELVVYAYEKTISSINKPKVQYMSKILEGWHEKGLKTVKEVDDFLSEEKQQKESDDGRLNINLEDIFELP